MSDSTSNSVSFPLDSADPRPLPEIIAEQYKFPLAYLAHIDGFRYYSVQDWIVGVAQTQEPRVFWAKLKKRLEKAEVELFPPCQQLPYRARNGRTYRMDYARADTLYQITQRMDAQTGLRDEILKFLAQAGVIVDEIRIDPDAAIDAAIEEYRRRGKDDRWISARLSGKIKRAKFTAALREAIAEVIGDYHYAAATDDIYLGLWERTSAQLRKQLDLPKNVSLRDNQPTLALTYQGLAEEVSAQRLGDQTELTWDEARKIVRAVATLIGAQAKATSAFLGVDIATGKPLLAGNSGNK